MAPQDSHGVISHDSDRPTDYLYRISIKCVVKNGKGEVLVVKETGRTWWDLPGGGMDHSETIELAIAREMGEEVSLRGDFTYRIIGVEDPKLLTAQSFWQIRLIFEVSPEDMNFSAGQDADDVTFMDPEVFRSSKLDIEQRIFRYANTK